MFTVRIQCSDINCPQCHPERLRNDAKMFSYVVHHRVEKLSVNGNTVVTVMPDTKIHLYSSQMVINLRKFITNVTNMTLSGSIKRQLTTKSEINKQNLNNILSKTGRGKKDTRWR